MFATIFFDDPTAEWLPFYVMCGGVGLIFIVGICFACCTGLGIGLSQNNAVNQSGPELSPLELTDLVCTRVRLCYYFVHLIFGLERRFVVFVNVVNVVNWVLCQSIYRMRLHLFPLCLFFSSTSTSILTSAYLVMSLWSVT